MDRTQLLKGVLDACILKIIEKQVTYGYEIMEQLKTYGFQEVKEGTIYPLLVRLENKALITSETRPSPLGPKRRYYTITQEGKQWLHQFSLYWKEINRSVDKLFS